jgi:hypothetical protein
LVGTAVLAALAGCAYQDPFALPGLPPAGTSSSVQVYPGSGYGGGYGSSYGGGYGYGYGYPNAYPSRYGYADPYYAGQGAYPYGYYRYPYNSYPQYIVVPCPDNNRDGRCDGKPPKDRNHDHQGHGDGNHDGNGDGDRDDTPVRPRDVQGVGPGLGPHTGKRGGYEAQRDAAPVIQPRTAPPPAPVMQQPARARPEPRRATPQDGANPRGPRSGRAPMTGDDVTPARPSQDP